jgi:hypothetical protein
MKKEDLRAAVSSLNRIFKDVSGICRKNRRVHPTALKQRGVKKYFFIMNPGYTPLRMNAIFSEKSHA